jgi:isocitrate dehydrogenase (NAD+)
LKGAIRSASFSGASAAALVGQPVVLRTPDRAPAPTRRDEHEEQIAMYKVTLIPGDGVGPEIAEATRKCIDATGVKIDWDVQECGIEVIEAEGGVPPRVLESIKANKVALKAPITTPIGKGFRSVNVYLRQELGLFACVRPCKIYKGVRTFFSKSNVDLVIVRENTEDLYAGVEFKAGEPKTSELIDKINSLTTGKKIGTGRDTTGISIKPISYEGTRQIADYAFKYAVENNRKSVTSICKANIMKFTDGLWYDETRAVALAYGAKFEWPDLAQGVKADPKLAGQAVNTDGNIKYIERLVDAMCMQLVQVPEDYDVLVMPNLYGDILSDLCAGLVGGLGVAPGANIGIEGAVFEATHGSAPKYKGQNKVNPTALILSGKLMLEHLGEREAAAKLERAVADVIAEGKDVTYDLKADRKDPSAVGTREMAEAIIRKMK